MIKNNNILLDLSKIGENAKGPNNLSSSYKKYLYKDNADKKTKPLFSQAIKAAQKVFAKSGESLPRDNARLMQVYRSRLLEELPANKTDIMTIYASVKEKKGNLSLQYATDQGKKIKAKKTATQEYL